MTARAVPSSPNFFAGQKLTGTIMNQTTTVATFWANPPGFSMLQAISQSFANTTYAQLTMDTPTWDSDGGRSGTSPYSYTIPPGMTGRWTITVKVAWAGAGGTNRLCAVYVNGALYVPSEVAVVSAAIANGAEIGTTVTIAVNAGDVISAWAYQGSGGALSTAAGKSFFEGRLESLGNP